MKRLLSMALVCMVMVFTVFTSIFVLTDTVQAATGTLKVHMLEIGTGRSDCFIVELPNGDNMVIDIPTGGNATITNKLNALGISSIKYLVATHSHGDHIGAIDDFLNSGFTIDNTRIYYPKGAVHETGTDYSNMVSAANSRGLTLSRLVRHDVVLSTTYDGKALEIRVVSPHNNKVDGGSDDYSMINSASLALQVRYGDKAMLFMADTQYQTENDILADSDTSDLWGQVLKVAHHGVLSGGYTTTTDAFLNKINAEYAFITNDTTSINSAIKTRLQTRNINYWIDGVSGDVWIATDGASDWYYSEAPTWP